MPAWRLRLKFIISLTCDKSGTTQNLLVQKEKCADALLTGIVSQRSLQNSPLESSCVVVVLIENYSTSKPLKLCPEKSQILSCVTVVPNMKDIFLKFKHNLYIASKSAPPPPKKNSRFVYGFAVYVDQLIFEICILKQYKCHQTEVIL